MEKILGIVFPWSPAKVLQIPSSLFCNKSLFALFKEKKRFWHFLVCKAKQIIFFFKSGDRGGGVWLRMESVAAVLRARSHCNTSCLLRVTLCSLTGQFYSPEGSFPLQVIITRLFMGSPL